jgi:hypothetical protein
VTKREFSATQYALFSSIMALPRCCLLLVMSRDRACGSASLPSG